MTEQQQRELAAGLKALAESTRHLGASAHVRERVGRLRLPQGVLAASYGEVSPKHAREFTARVGGWLPLAAALLLATTSALWVAHSSAPPTGIEPAGFVALPDAERLPLMESANIVRVSLPVAALPAYGVAVADLNTESVEAELLVAQDGQARAIRLVNDFTDTRSANND